MLKIVQTGKLILPKNIVFQGLTDISFVKKELKRMNYETNLKIQYDRKDPFGVGKSIFLLDDGPQVQFKVLENKPPNLLKVKITSNNKKINNIAGHIIYSAELDGNNEITKYKYTYQSSTTPQRLHTKIFLKVAVLFARIMLFNTNRRFIKHIQNHLMITPK